MELELRVLELRKTGAALEAIARALGTSKTSVIRARDRALARLDGEVRREAAAYLALQLARYEDLLTRAERLLRAEAVTRPDGTAATDERGHALTRLPDPEVYARGLMVKAAVLARIDHLLGLAAAGGAPSGTPAPEEDVLVIEVHAGRRRAIAP